MEQIQKKKPRDRKQYYKKNKEVIKKQTRDRYWKKKEEIQALKQKWYQENKKRLLIKWALKESEKRSNRNYLKIERKKTIITFT